MVSKVLKIVNEKGLHARASARFVEVVESHDARAEVEKDGMRVSGDSIMGLLMLAASRGTTIAVTTHGLEADSWPMRLRRWSPTGLAKTTNSARAAIQKARETARLCRLTGIA